ncbi:response regulator [Paenibacillus solisilvae]|uniref:Response regulator n=1 Tax=Paenibacillus solisilvae TaxID=2486751 RepID=A0ABW0VX96_9BACL
MTIRLLIVDDEPVICQGLRQTIPWDKIGVGVAGEAYDGAEALQFVSAQPVDLVLTDINMVGMDGLELAKELKERWPQIRIIIVSGYDDFEYARRALRLGIEDYLLKPVNIEELMAMVLRICTEISHDAEQEKKRERESWVKWMIQLVQGGAAIQKDAETPPSAAHVLSSYRFVASQLEDYAEWTDRTPEEQQQSARKLWESTVHASLKPYDQEVISFFHHPNLLLSLCIGSRQVSRLDLTNALSEAQSLVPSAPRLHFGVSPAFSQLDEASPRCMEAIAALQLTAVPDDRTVLFHNDEQISRRHPLPFSPFELEKQLVHVLFHGSYEELDEVIGSIMRQFRERGYLVKEILQAFKELSIILQRRLHTNGMDLSERADLFNTGEVDLLVHNSYRAMESLLRKELWSLHSIIHSSLSNKNHWITERVNKHIYSRYHTDLKASEVAAWLKITPNYFSNLFKQNFGKGFAEYLNEVRIERAKASLVGTDERVFEIAEKVGYKEYKYFCSIFKSYTGITPTQYRKLAKTGSTAGKD